MNLDVKKTALTLTVAALALPVAAVAGPPAGKGKPPATGEKCKPKVTVVLKGVATSDPDSAATSFTMDVKGGNRFGRQLVSEPATSLTVNADLTAPGTTKVRRAGKQSNLEALQTGDRVLVQFRLCKADLAGDAASDKAALEAASAVRVVAHAPSSDS
jgi:hypothetical protein